MKNMEALDCTDLVRIIPHHSYGNQSSDCKHQENETWKEVKRSIVDGIGPGLHRRVTECLNNACANECNGILICLNRSG